MQPTLEFEINSENVRKDSYLKDRCDARLI
jgi:hypothetical protein